MLKVFINDNDRSAFLEEGSLTILEQIQNKSNTCNFELMPGVTAPSENQELEIYDVIIVVTASGTTIEAKDVLKSGLSVLDRGKIREGQAIWLDIGGSDQQKLTVSEIVASATAGQVKITTVETITGSPGTGDFVGRLIFGGTISATMQFNPRQLTDVAFKVKGIDFTKIFDKKNVNDSWEDVDSRYIINDALNTTINLNDDIDDMDYANDGAVQAEWIETGDGDNPTLNSTNFIQGTSAIDLNWTNAGGTATFTASPTSADVSELTGVSSGAPTEGNISFWYKPSIASGITSVAIRYGSDASHYVEVSFVPESDTDVHFQSLKLVDGSVTGTPDWTAADYVAIIVTQTGNGSIMFDDIRITAEGSFTMFNFELTSDFDDVRASFRKPTQLIDALAKALGYYWYIDYERDIHFFDRETNTAPFSLSDTSDNFNALTVDVDTSQLKNRQVVRGGTKVTTTTYSQVFEGDSAVREWITKSQTKNLTVEIDDNSSTDLMEAGTTGTNVTATGHGLVTGDYIVNRTRSNAVRQVTRVDDDNFTVETVAAQASGDTFSKFDTAKTVGIEFITDETTVDYISNFNEKSVRATDSEATLDAGDFILFTYNEVIPIRVQVDDAASIFSLKAIIGGDGIFDGTVINDKSLDSTQSARDRAKAELEQFSNPITKISFTTDHDGLSAGQIINIVDSNKGISDDFIIQRVSEKFKTGDFAIYSVICASTLFGLVEYFQKLSEGNQEKLIDSEEEIDLITGEIVTITITEVNTFVPAESASEAETITISPSESATDREMTTDPYKYQPHASDARWNLAQYK